VSHALWRISTDTPEYTADDLRGEGAKVTGGRWNQVGEAVVYTSETRALACLETLVHLGSTLPFNRYLVRVEIPDDVWMNAITLQEADLKVGWDALPAGKVSMETGSKWLAGGRSCLLVVPSIVAPEEKNVLVNPAHADHRKLTATKVRRWLYDPRLGA
jgi:RES domain-containing protein